MKKRRRCAQLQISDHYFKIISKLIETERQDNKRTQDLEKAGIELDDFKYPAVDLSGLILDLLGVPEEHSMPNGMERPEEDEQGYSEGEMIRDYYDELIWHSKIPTKNLIKKLLKEGAKLRKKGYPLPSIWEGMK